MAGKFGVWVNLSSLRAELLKLKHHTDLDNVTSSSLTTRVVARILPCGAEGFVRRPMRQKL